MKIQYASDLHIEFPSNYEYLKENPLIPSADILVLAGDITVFDLDIDNTIFDNLSQQFKEIYYVVGNHEFYGGKANIAEYHKPIKKQFYKNITLVNNVCIPFGDVNLIFTPLFSNVPEKFILDVQFGVGDFRRTNYNDHIITIDDFHSLHESAKQFIIKSLDDNKDMKNVIISHFAPTRKCSHYKHKFSKVNSFFSAQMDDIINNYKIDYWIYGHSHTNMPEIEMNGCKIISNMFGYVDFGEVTSFINNAIIEV